MKKTILSAVIASVVSFGATANEEFNWDFYGELGLGGEVYLEGDDKGKYLDGSYMDLALAFEKGNWFGLAYLEGWTVSAVEKTGETWVPGHGVRGWEGGFNRVYVGYKFEGGKELTFGRMDSALDEMDGYSDFTVEYGLTPSEAGDISVGLKLKDVEGDFRYGISVAPESSYNSDDQLFDFGKYDHYGDKFEKAAVANGYVEYRMEGIKVMAGAEVTDGEGNIMMVGANFFDHIGFRAWHDTDKGSYGEENGFVLNGMFEPSEGLYLSAGYNYADREKGSDVQFVNAGMWYAFGANEQYAFAVDTYLPKDGENKVFVKQFFYF